MEKGVTIIHSRENLLFDGTVGSLSEALDRSGVTNNTLSLEELASVDFTIDASNVNQVVYLYNNHPAVSTFAHLLLHNKRAVINSQYLQAPLAKYVIQMSLRSNGIDVPGTYFAPTLHHSDIPLKFPVICKSFRHNEKTFLLRDSSSLVEFDTCNNVATPCYFEEYYDNSTYPHFKAYGVGDKVFFDRIGEKVATEALAHKTRYIAKIIGLEVYSIDYIFVKEGDSFFVIDVNFAPGFYGSPLAQEHFIKFFIDKLN